MKIIQKGILGTGPLNPWH